MVTVVHSPDHLLSLDEWDALPEDNSRRYELVEGVLVVSPKALPQHQRICWRLAAQLEPQLSEAWTVVIDTELAVDSTDPPTVRAPDSMVVRTAVYNQNPPRFDPADVLLAVEVLSKGTRRTDQITKFAEYSEVGITHYWLIDPVDPLSLLAYRLIGGEYEQVGEGAGRMSRELDGASVVLNLAELKPRATKPK